MTSVSLEHWDNTQSCIVIEIWWGSGFCSLLINKLRSLTKEERQIACWHCFFLSSFSTHFLLVQRVKVVNIVSSAHGLHFRKLWQRYTALFSVTQGQNLRPMAWRVYLHREKSGSMPQMKMIIGTLIQEFDKPVHLHELRLPSHIKTLKLRFEKVKSKAHKKH